MKLKALAYGLVVVCALLGLLQVGRGIRTVYGDYQDFKAIRAWAVEMNKLQQQQLKAKQHQADPAK